VKELEFENGKRVNYDLLIGIPPHKVPEVIRNSGLIKQGQNWINVDKFSLKTEYENVFAIGDVTEIKVNENTAIPKAGVFAEAQAKVVSQQIVDDIENDRGKGSSPRFDGKGFCFMEVGNKKAGYVAADFYNEQGPATLLEPPSEESYKKKIDFERSKLDEWLFL
jgi:sulfide:quinone oxidoreductase